MSTQYPGQEGAPAAVLTVKLTKPIQNNELVEITEIAFREPTAGDVIRFGNPVRVDLDSAMNPPITVDDAKMGAMISQLSNLLPPMIARMHPQDLVQCGWDLAHFFIPARLTAS